GGELGSQAGAEFADEASAGRDAELAGVGAGAGDDVGDRVGVGLGEADRFELGVEVDELVVGDPAEDEVLLDGGAGVGAAVGLLAAGIAAGGVGPGAGLGGGAGGAG